MKNFGVFLLLCLLLLAGCARVKPSGYSSIGQEEARERMAGDENPVIVDVRRFDEYRTGHIPGAVCIPNESIGAQRPEELPNPDQLLLLYCRRGNRSKEAAEKLAALGYTRVYEFGGITDWTGEVAAGQSLLLTVKANPTTGFVWAAEAEGASVDIRSWYTAEPVDGPVAGSGGTQSFLLTPKESGVALVNFSYVRPWEERSEDDTHFACALTVHEDLSLTLTEDGSEDAARQGYPPTWKIYG